MNMNDKNYWQHRFETDWEEAHGPEQSFLHYQILIERLPKWLKKEIKNIITLYVIWDVEWVKDLNYCMKIFQNQILSVWISHEQQ